MTQPVIHFEIVGPDAKVLQDYYSSLFDWKIDANNAMNYGMVEAGEGGIAGGVAPTMDGQPNVTFYVQVPDLQAALNKAEKLGGKTLMPPMDVPEGPSIAQFTDPAGNRIGLVKV
jgi:predicted enzyme related to lactoylglutathione lyase